MKRSYANRTAHDKPVFGTSLAYVADAAPTSLTTEHVPWSSKHFATFTSTS
jgi:hypothetical protein